MKIERTVCLLHICIVSFYIPFINYLCIVHICTNNIMHTFINNNNKHDDDDGNKTKILCFKNAKKSVAMSLNIYNCS